MLRALLLLAAALPAVLHAGDVQLIPPSCAHPADLEDRRSDPAAFRGTYIVFTRGTDLAAGIMTLLERYHWDGYAVPTEKRKGLDAVHFLLAALTPEQMAELRCEPVVEGVILGQGAPPPERENRPPPKVRLGIAMRPVSDEEVGGRLARGVAVTSVMPDSVATRTGLLAKDYILRFNDHDINSMQDLLKLMMEMNPGDAVPMVVLRGGNEIRVIARF